MRYSIIQKSKLEGALRLDAEYYQPEYFIDFSKGNWRPIGKLLEICQYGISQAMNDEKIGYPIFKMDDIKDTFLFDDKVRYVDISKNVFNEFKLEKNDVLFNRVNSEEFVGRTGMFKLDTNAVFASYLIRLKLKNSSVILPDYLNIFLNSSFGIKQIRKFRRRAVNQANVNAEELKQIKIAVLPTTFQKEIEKLSNEAWQNFKNSKSLYSQAENLLLEKLGLKDFKLEEKLSYIVNLSDVKSFHRADAEYFQPKYDKLISKIKTKSKIYKLQEVAMTKRGSLINPRFYNEVEGTPYIRGKDFSSGRLEKSGLVYISIDFRPKNETRVSTGNLVFALIGSVGTSALVDEEFDNSFISNNTGKITIKNKNEIIPEYLAAILNSVVGKLQFEKEASQTAQPKISDSQVRNFYIPILPKPTQQKIAELVQKSHKDRKKAKQLLEQAKQKVEELIEK